MLLHLPRRIIVRFSSTDCNLCFIQICCVLRPLSPVIWSSAKRFGYNCGSYSVAIFNLSATIVRSWIPLVAYKVWVGSQREMCYRVMEYRIVTWWLTEVRGRPRVRMLFIACRCKNKIIIPQWKNTICTNVRDCVCVCVWTDNASLTFVCK